MSLNLWAGVLLSGAAVALLLYRTDFAAVGVAFRSAQYLWVLPGVGVILSVLLLRAWRWGYLMTRSRRPSFESRLSATSIGFMANGLLPARMGEFIRAWSLGRREGTSKSAAFASIVVERLLDGGWILLFLWIALLSVPFPEGDGGMAPFLQGAGLLSLGLYASVLAFLVLLSGPRRRLLSHHPDRPRLPLAGEPEPSDPLLGQRDRESPPAGPSIKKVKP